VQDSDAEPWDSDPPAGEGRVQACAARSLEACATTASRKRRQQLCPHQQQRSQLQWQKQRNWQQRHQSATDMRSVCPDRCFLRPLQEPDRVMKTYRDHLHLPGMCTTCAVPHVGVDSVAFHRRTGGRAGDEDIQGPPAPAGHHGRRHGHHDGHAQGAPLKGDNRSTTPGCTWQRL